MNSGAPIVTLDDATYFVNLAVIAGALIGLTFISLNLFMVDMLRKYEDTALPVFRDRETVDSSRKPLQPNPPESLTDYELLDGDPVVVFMAYSVAVTWSLFLLPLVVGLTVSWTRRWGVLAAEMLFFSLLLVSNFYIRNEKVKQMKPYLTREELLWPVMSGVAFTLYLSTFLSLFFITFPAAVPSFLHLAVWSDRGFASEQVSMFLVKISCIVSLVLGTYTLNKDMFIFFKSAAAERMRDRWLKTFIQDTYPQLRERVRSATLNMPFEVREADELWMLWNNGPALIATHEFLRKTLSDDSAHLLWKRLVDGGGVPIWMLVL
jgi:hypothetical protein